jgi:hypothetical protein
MKKIFCVFAGLFLSGALLFAGGGKQDQSSGAGGLTTLRVFDENVAFTFGVGETVYLSDWISGKVPSRLWEQFNADLAKHGIKLRFDLVEEDQKATTVRTMLASGKFNDYDWLNIGDFDERARQALVDQGRLYAINQLVSQYSTGEAKTFYNSDTGKAFAGLSSLEDGNFYWIQGGYNDYMWKSPDNPHGNFQYTRIRQDWLDKLGIAMPTTLDQYYNALTAFRTKDVNGNGRQDEVADIAVDHFQNGVAQWFGLGTNWVSLFKNGTVASPWYQPNVKEYIAFMNRLYRAGVLRINGAGPDMNNNIIGVSYSWSTDTWTEPGITMPAGAAKAYFVPMMIQAVSGTAPLAWEEAARGFASDRLYVVSKATKNAAGIAKLLDYIMSDTWQTFAHYGIEGYTFDMVNGSPVSRQQPNSAGTGIDMTIASTQSHHTFTRFLPRMRLNQDKQPEAANVMTAFSKENGYPDGGQTKYRFVVDGYENKFGFVQDINSKMAPATIKELDRITAIRPDLETYCQELLTGLITGQKNVSGWDGYMADLKRLGLDELVSIYQARINRAKK